MFLLAILFLAGALPLHGQTNAIATNALPVLIPPYGELPPTLPERLQMVTSQHPAFAMLAGLGMIALVAFGVWIALRPRPKIIIPPAVQAQLALEALRAQPEDGTVLSRISQVVQNYFIAAFQLAPGKFTTAEFSHALSGHEQVGAELSTAAINFLHDCDTRKFSAADVSAPFNAANQALNLVEQAEQRRARLRQLSETQTQGRRA